MKTKDEALELAKKIRLETNSLPDVSLFGESNVEGKAESEQWAKALDEYAHKGTIPLQPADAMLQVYNWITDKGWSVLEDYDN